MNGSSDSENKKDLLEEITILEQALARRSRKDMELLLHPDFAEFGRSGRRYTRADVLSMFAGTVLPPIEYRDVDLTLLAEGVVLLTYLSADADGNPQSLRSSIWMHTGAGWRIRFHQGTKVHQPDCSA